MTLNEFARNLNRLIEKGYIDGDLNLSANGLDVLGYELVMVNTDSNTNTFPMIEIKFFDYGKKEIK